MLASSIQEKSTRIWFVVDDNNEQLPKCRPESVRFLVRLKNRPMVRTSMSNISNDYFRKCVVSSRVQLETVGFSVDLVTLEISYRICAELD